MQNIKNYDPNDYPYYLIEGILRGKFSIKQRKIWKGLAFSAEHDTIIMFFYLLINGAKKNETPKFCQQNRIL